MKFDKRTLILHEMLTQQICPLDKTRLGYNKHKKVEEGESSRLLAKKVEIY